MSYLYPIKKQEVTIRTSTLVLIALSTLFFSRTLDALGAPSLINFAHFFFVPAVCVLAVLSSRTRDLTQIAGAQLLLLSILAFFTINVISAMINGAGFINIALNFLLLSEPFIMLLALVSLALSTQQIRKLKNWLLVFALYNLFLAYFQRYGLGESNPDYIYGAFFSIAGATVSSIVSLGFAIYYLLSERNSPIWIRVFISTAAFWQIIISDTKLVLGSFVVGFLLFSLSKISRKTLVYVILGAVLLWAFLWALDNVPFFRAYAIWIDLDLLTDPNSEFYRAKLTTFRLVPDYYSSILNWFFGVGPGHGVGRLGGWMLEKYGYLLDPIGATHPYPEMSTEIMSTAAGESRHVMGTAMYGPLFSWSGIWSDLGILGSVFYLLIWVVVLRYFCLHDFSRYLVMVTFALGLFPGYLEEPGSMLFTTFIIGLWWHEQKQLKDLPDFRQRTFNHASGSN